MQKPETRIENEVEILCNKPSQHHPPPEDGVVAHKLLRNGSLNALPGNRYVLNNRRIVGSGVFFAVCSEAT
jgi:hypothetical protein